MSKVAHRPREHPPSISRASFAPLCNSQTQRMTFARLSQHVGKKKKHKTLDGADAAQLGDLGGGDAEEIAKHRVGVLADVRRG